MGAPTSEVGYTSATTRKKDNEVYMECGGIWGGGGLRNKNFRQKFHSVTVNVNIITLLWIVVKYAGLRLVVLRRRSQFVGD
jgi:hypothetical protein